MAESSKDWMPYKDAAKRVGRAVPTIYKWMSKPQEETGIRRRQIGQIMYVHVPTLLDSEATVKIGRPRKPR